MSYRESVPDSSRATPHFYSKSHYPIKTHRSSYFDLATSSIVSKKLGAVKPWWVKAAEYGEKGARWYWKNRRWLKYYKHPGWFYNNETKTSWKPNRKKSSRSNIQAGHGLCRCQFHGGRKSAICPCRRPRWKGRRTNIRYRRPNSYRKRY